MTVVIKASDPPAGDAIGDLVQQRRAKRTASVALIFYAGRTRLAGLMRARYPNRRRRSHSHRRRGRALIGPNSHFEFS